MDEKDIDLFKEELEITPCEDLSVINNDTNTVKLQLSPSQKSSIELFAHYIPTFVASGTMAQLYAVKFPLGAPHNLLSLGQGGFSSTLVDNGGKFAGTASLFPVKLQAAILGAFSAMSVASGQYFLKRINNELGKMNQNLDKILEFLYGDKKAELMSEISFVKYAYSNYSSIMSHDSQREATISGIQEAKKVAMKDIEFYISDLDFTVNSRDGFNIDATVNKAFQIKDSLELSMQLLLMSNVLEVYYSQNYDKFYLQYIEKDVASYIDKCEKRMLSSFSVLNSRVHDFKGKIWEKIDKSSFEDQLGKIVDLLNSSEESQLRKSLHAVLKSASNEMKYYITTDGNIYLKTT